MRSDEFPLHKSSKEELRVLVVGDSIIYGGVRVDQKDIGTELLKSNLEKDLGRPVVVGNISAKGWGPPNELAYLKRYGTFDADVVILELSSHDYGDSHVAVPVVGISADFPDKSPRFALQDLFETYLLPRYFHVGETPESTGSPLDDKPPSSEQIRECREAERQIYSFVRNHNARVVLLQHFTLPEIRGKYAEGYYANQAVAREQSVPFVDDREQIESALKAGISPYYDGDPLHMNTAGQQILQRVMENAINLALSDN